MEKSFSSLTRNALHVSCNAFHSGFWQNGTPCDLLSIDLLIRLFSHIKTPQQFFFPTERTPPVYRLVFLILAFSGSVFERNLHTIASMISNMSHAYSEITPYVRCIVWIAKVAFGSPCFWLRSVNLLQPDFREWAVYYPLSVWQRCLPAFLCLAVHMGIWRIIWFGPTV